MEAARAEEGEPPPQYVGSAEALSLSILPPPGPSEAPLNSWDAAEVGAWVARSVRLPQYAGRFVSQEVDGTLISVVDDHSPHVRLVRPDHTLAPLVCALEPGAPPLLLFSFLPTAAPKPLPSCWF